MYEVRWPNKERFQWDDCFGITVIVPKSTDLDKAYNTLKDLCENI